MDVITGSISPLGIKVSGLISQAVLRGLSAYQVAVKNGYEGSQEQWIRSLRGEAIEFKSEGLKIYYKYESDSDWTLLVQIDQLMADYEVLDNKPKINSIELIGNKTLSQLGIQERRNGYSLVQDTEIERLSHVDNYDDTEIRQAIEAIVLAAVTGVKGVAESEFRKGNVTLTPANLGLGNVDNTRDSAKHVLSAVQDADGRVIPETYFSGVSHSSGTTYLTRPDGTSAEVPVSDHDHDASEIVSGTIDIARLPAGALERMVDVENRTARYALTTATVQNGDTVRQLDTGVMYRVVDDTKLNKADGYKEYTAGRASAVPWSGVQDKPQSFTPSSHTHRIADITNIAGASVAEAGKLKIGRLIGITGGATATGVQFDGTSNIVLNVTALDATKLSGTAPISITGNAATATQFSHQRTIEVTGKATASPKVYDGRQNIALEVTALDAADKVHTHTMSDITDLSIQSDRISDFSTSNVDTYLDVWFSDQLISGKPVHNSGIQYNPSRDILKAGTFQGNLTGTASSASALTTDAGSATHPVYFANGIPVATTYELNATVPADAVFTDTNTHYASEIVIAGNFNSKVDTQTALSNGNVFINHIENNQVTSSHKITGTGTTTVTTDEFGNIIVNATGNEYTQGSGISISNYVITNTGVRAVTESTENGNITVNTNGTTANIPVHGLGTAAYTDATAYAASNHSHAFSSITSKPTTLSGYGITDAANISHGHDASDITSGTIDIARLPAGAIERLVTVANQAARYALTKSQVQNGDTVQQEDTGVMYRVVDDDNLDKAQGYKEYVAGTASAVPWSGITGKPESFTPSTHSHTISDISDITTATVASADQLTTSRTISLTGAVTGSVSFDGSENVTLDTSVNHTHYYAGSQTIGGIANEAAKLSTSSAGNSVTPVYFYQGVPVGMSYQLNATVPADAVFTDTHHVSSTVINSADDSTSNATRALSNGNVFLNHVENGVVRSSHAITGTGSVTVTYNGSGDIIINGAGQEYTALPNPYALSINGYTYDGSQAINVGIIDVAHGGTGSSTVDSAPTQDSSRMVTSGGVYTALAGKSDTGHTHSYAGSSTAGGSATSAEKLNPLTDAGSATQPIFFSSGKPAACTYALNATVPADAVFTDTHHQAKNVVGSTSSATSDTTETVANGYVFLNLVENGTVRSSHRITGTGDLTVTTDSSGNIVIHCTDTDTKYVQGTGITISGTTISNAGVRSIAQGSTNGTISVNTDGTSAEVAVKGLGSAAYTDTDAYAAASHTHQYAGSSSAGGSANSAVKLDSDAGSAIQPIYFSSGKPVATTYSLGASVPANAVFTDTHYASKTVIAGANDAIVDTSSSLTNTHVFINHVENGAVTASHRISGSGSATVTTDSSGNILISAEDTKYTALPNPYSLSINGSTYDGSEAVDVGVLGVAYGGTGNSEADTVPTENSTKFLPSGAIYTALASKADSSHTHLYAGSSIAGGSATSAVKLDSNGGSATQPVYFTGGKPTACTYELNKTVPADAVFTDTHYASKTVVAGTNDATSDTSSSLTNTHVFLNHIENGAVVSAHRISGSGATTVTTDSSGNIVITSEDTKYTTLPNPYAITIQANGTSLGTYDGSEAKSFNLTYSNVGAAAASHGHAWSDISSTPTTLAGYGITDQIASKTHIHDASEIQSGVLDIARIPVSALERLIVVDDLTEMYTLTTSEVQLGDTVQCEDTGLMYRVVDTANLDNANGYKVYTAGAAASVPWSGITGKPSEFTPATHSHLYAGSSVAGGSATSAEALTTISAGSATNPVFFSGGKPSACTYELNKTVPADAVFTDTHHQAKAVVGSSASATSDTNTGLTNGNVYLNIIENGSVRSSHKISGGDDVKVTTDANGNIVITSSDTKYTHPTHTAHSSGMYKITVDEYGHVSAATAIVKADITGLGISASDHTHSLDLATDSGTNHITLAASTKYKLTAGGQTLIFTTAPDTKYTHPTHTEHASGLYKVTVDASGHVSAATAVAKADITALGISASDHNHTLTLAKTPSATSTVSLEAGAIYTLTAGGNTVVFTATPDTKYSQGTGITITGTTIANAGVRAVSQGSTNGTVKVNTGGTEANVAVHGLGTAAYKADTYFATSGHDHSIALVKDTTATSTVTLEANQIYKLTAGGSTVVFTTSPDTKYSQGTGISISGTTISNSGVRSIATGASNGTISVNTGGTSKEVSVYGLGSAAYTDSSAYAGSSHTHNYAGSSSAGGAATSAIKFTTAREISVNLASVYNSSTNHPVFNGQANFTAPITGTLGVANGGTGATTFTSKGILYGNGTGAVAATAQGSSGQLLKSNGTSAPSWEDQSNIIAGKANKLSTARNLLVVLGTASTTGEGFDGSKNLDGSDNSHKGIPISGTLGVAHGGTGQTTLTANGILYGAGTSGIGATAAGASNYWLKGNGPNSAPSWQAQSNFVAGKATKLETARTISVSGAVTGGIKNGNNTNGTFDGSAAIELVTSIALATGDNPGQVKIAGTNISVNGLGSAAYKNMQTTDIPTHNSGNIITSGGIHKRIAYKKITLDKTAWTMAYDTDNDVAAEVYLQCISTGGDITANTQIVSAKLVGSSTGNYSYIYREQEFTADGTTKVFTVDYEPYVVLNSYDFVVKVGGTTVSGYNREGSTITFTNAPSPSGVKILVCYYQRVNNDEEFSRIKEVQTYASKVQFLAYEPPFIDITVVIGYVSETLDALSTQAAIQYGNRFSEDELVFQAQG